MMTDLAPPQIRGMTGLELAAGVFAKCSDQLATQLKISLTSGRKDAGPLPFSIGINGDVYGGMRAPLEVGMRRVDIAYVNPSAMVAMAYRGKGYYKQKMELRVLGCFPSWDRIALVVSKDLGVKSHRRHRPAQNPAACLDALVRCRQRDLFYHRDDSWLLRILLRANQEMGRARPRMQPAIRPGTDECDQKTDADGDLRRRRQHHRRLVGSRAGERLRNHSHRTGRSSKSSSRWVTAVRYCRRSATSS